MKDMVCYSKRIGDYHLASAEASLLDDKYTTPTGAVKPTYYFNRIFVPKEARHAGVGHELLSKLQEYMYANNCALMCEINPYDGSTFDDLFKWYTEHHFEPLEYFDGVPMLWLNA